MSSCWYARVPRCDESTIETLLSWLFKYRRQESREQSFHEWWIKQVHPPNQDFFYFDVLLLFEKPINAGYIYSTLRWSFVFPHLVVKRYDASVNLPEFLNGPCVSGPWNSSSHEYNEHGQIVPSKPSFSSVLNSPPDGQIHLVQCSLFEFNISYKDLSLYVLKPEMNPYTLAETLQHEALNQHVLIIHNYPTLNAMIPYVSHWVMDKEYRIKPYS
jgi:hypothetical protein